MSINSPESYDPTEEFYDDRKQYLIRRDQLCEEGYSLSCSYSHESADGWAGHLQEIKEQFISNGFKVIQVTCDLQTALYYKINQ